MIRALLFLLLLALPASAQDFSGLARIDPARSEVRDDGDGLRVSLALSQPVPYRVFTLDAPRRLVVDFREVDWSGMRRETLLNADGVTDLGFGPLRPGWSRLVLLLAGPMQVVEAGMDVSQTDGTADLTLRLARSTEESFAALAGAPDGADWGDLEATPAPSPDPATENDRTLIVVIDPGHGGIDPGAIRGDLIEADLMLQLGFEVADALNRVDGIRAILTRDGNAFVPLSARISAARAANADLFISLHADALEEDEARGASVYTLSDEAEDRASQRMAERHERGDLLAGLDLSGQEDRVATVLMDLARRETAPKSDRFADALTLALQEAGATLNSRPRREAPLAVLNAADFPSVLLEAGFLSSASDRDRLSRADGRAPIVTAIVRAVQRWAQDEAARAPLVRQ